ncbi:hypothetical protein Vi05172_g9854 [Venturia inaequalis]|uniref:Secreted protein n=1 Tax=Venturia inaequalis TaxID=5025 RepID=A0A8H3UJS4_VENIN|nr:hypothetical protein EG327_010166 [Venturia inaequalis]RDI80192.1 hypothetical protein Vi05172_g9854 [Venturia inaequalis]
MYFSFILPLALLAAFLPDVLACTARKQNCCWGGTDNGFVGCYNQHNFSDNLCRDKKYTADYCSRHKISAKDCSSDCCDIKTKKGIKCPGAKHGIQLPSFLNGLGSLTPQDLGAPKGGGSGGDPSGGLIPGLGSIFGGGSAGAQPSKPTGKRMVRRFMS